MRIGGDIYWMFILSVAVTLSVVFPVQAVTLGQFDQLNSDEKDQVFEHIVTGVALNSFGDRSIQECGMSTFYTQIEGLRGLSQGDITFFEMMDSLKAEGRLDVRVQDMIYTIIQRNCVE